METEQKGFFARNMKWLVVLGIIALVVFWGITKFNGFVRQGESITAQWAQVENQYQRKNKDYT